MSLVSIITATYNSSKYIKATYDSIVSQSHGNWEWLITDDCSSDDTFKLLEKLSTNDSRIKIFKNEINSGAAVTRNVSISYAKGDFIAFLDSDDLWLPEKLTKQIDFMGEDINFSFTAYELIDQDGTLLHKSVGTHYNGSFSYIDQLRRKCVIGCSTVVLRRKAFENMTMPLIRTRQDYALWLKLLKTGCNADSLNEVLTQYRLVANSISSDKVKAAKQTWYVYRYVENLSLVNSYICFIFYAWTAVFKKK